MHVQLYELAQKYGPVMKIYIFTKPVVVLNTADVIYEAKIIRGMVCVLRVKSFKTCLP